MYNENSAKNHILKSAIDLMNTHGYGGLRISELARASNISRQNLYYHYPSMEDIILELGDLWGSTGRTCTQEALALSTSEGANRILVMIEGMFIWMKKYPELSKLGLTLFQSENLIPKLHTVMSETREQGLQRITSILENDKLYGGLKAKQKKEIVTSIHSTMYGFYLYVVLMKDFNNLDIHYKNCRENLNRLLKAYRE